MRNDEAPPTLLPPTPPLTTLGGPRRRAWPQPTPQDPQPSSPPMKGRWEDQHPHNFHVDISLTQLIQECSWLQPGHHLRHATFRWQGGSMPKELPGESSSSVTFKERGSSCQSWLVPGNYTSEEEFIHINNKLHQGDMTGIQGILEKPRRVS